MAVAQELLELNLCSFLSRISRFDASLDQKKRGCIISHKYMFIPQLILSKTCYVFSHFHKAIVSYSCMPVWWWFYGKVDKCSVICIIYGIAWKCICDCLSLCCTSRRQIKRNLHTVYKVLYMSKLQTTWLWRIKLSISLGLNNTFLTENRIRSLKY